MLQQDLQAQQDQDHAAGQLRPASVPCAEQASNLDARAGKQKGDGANKEGCCANMYLKEGKAHAHRQSVNTGGYGQGQHFSEG